MSDFPELKITSAGLSALVSASNQGLQAKITHMAVGEGSYTPTGFETTLRQEKERREINDYTDQGAATYLACLFDGENELTIGEVGIFLEDGTLFGVASHPLTIIGFKAAGSQNVHLQRLAIQTEVLPVDSISVVVGDVELSLIIVDEMAAIGTAIARNDLEQLRIADRIKEMTGEY